jgi:hypothetical protein
MPTQSLLLMHAQAHPTTSDGGNLYDVGEDDGTAAGGKTAATSRPPAGAAGSPLYDMGDDIKPQAQTTKAQSAKREVQQVALYDTGDNDTDTEDVGTRAAPSRASLATITTRLSESDGMRSTSAGALYDVASGNTAGSNDGGYLAVDADDLA